MVIAVTISCELRKIVSARSTVTLVSIARPVWSTPVTRSVSRGSSGSGRIRNSSAGSLMGELLARATYAGHRKARPSRAFLDAGLPHASPLPAIVASASAQRDCSLRRSSAQTAEQPDQQDDRQRNADEPKQCTASHGQTSNSMNLADDGRSSFLKRASRSRVPPWRRPGDTLCAQVGYRRLACGSRRESRSRRA